MKRLGGSIFTHNVDQFDYCFRESIDCLLEFCDEVVVLDCQSTDGTLPILRKIASQHAKLKLIEGAEWEVGHKHERLAILANQAKSYLTTPWHFMLQADEVVHESSFPVIRSLIEPGNAATQRFRSFAVRRYNLFGDFSHMVSLTSAHKPCNDAPIRLGHVGLPAVGDAESIEGQACSWHYVNEIEIFHYGLVRKSEALLDKSIDMQTWFHGSEHSVDYRVKEMKADGHFNPFRLIARSEIVPHGRSHPKFMTDWIQARALEKIQHMTQNGVGL